MEKGGLFLTEKGYVDATALYELAMAGDNVNLVLNVREKMRYALSAEDATFDDYYTAIYGLKLTNYHDFFKVGREVGPQAHRVAGLTAMLEMDFRYFDRKAGFAQSLLNEYMVADIMYFNSALRELLPYHLTIEKVGVGCLWLEYNVYEFGEASRRDPLPYLEKTDFGWNGSGDGPAMAQAWAALKKRFHAEIELNTI